MLPSLAASQAQGQRIIFSDGHDGNALKLLDVDSGHVTVLRGAKSWLRYSDFGVNYASAAADSDSGIADWVLAIEEDHCDPLPKDVKNYVVGINIRTKQVVRLVSGADFYTNPRFSRDGKWAAWRQWHHPEMPWTKSGLYWAPVSQGDDGRLVLGESSRVAGGEPEEPVGEALWGPDGALYFTHEVVGNDWRQMFRAWPAQGVKAEKLPLKGLEETEIGNCSMMLDSYVWPGLSNGLATCH